MPALKLLWSKYKLFVEKSINKGVPQHNAVSIDYWRQHLFINGTIYTIPSSLIALVPCVIVTYNHGHRLIPAYDIFLLAFLSCVIFSKKLSFNFKRSTVMVMFYLLAIILMASLGSFGIGSIYLLAVSVMIALTYPDSVSYKMIGVNFLTYLIFGFIIYFKLFNSPLIHNYSISYWVDYSLNFMFLNIVVVTLITSIINGLEGAVVKEGRLLKQLQGEAIEKIKRNELLRESEGHYRSLFFLNPSPMWIFDSKTLKFLQVNDAAIEKYGYTEDEFLDMTIDDIRVGEDVSHLLGALTDNKSSTAGRIASQLITQHSQKDGQQFYVDVRCSTIPFQGKEAWLVIARNINTQIEHTQAIEKQNTILREIAFMQSHVVRAPLARIMGLIDLMTKDIHEKPDPTLLNYLNVSTKELDQVIRSIINNTEEAFAVINSRDIAD